jgi:hypothetical protein
MLVTWTRYKTITGDRAGASAEVEEALLDAQGLLEDALSRSIERADYTEDLPLVSDPETGTLACFPTVYPVHSTANGDLVRFNTVYGVGPTATPVSPGDFGLIFPLVVTLTYNAGWDATVTDRTDPAFLPRDVERDIAWAAHTLLNPSLSSAIPTGAKSATSGDVSITYDRAQSSATLGIRWSPGTLSWRRITL